MEVDFCERIMVTSACHSGLTHNATFNTSVAGCQRHPVLTAYRSVSYDIA